MREFFESAIMFLFVGLNIGIITGIGIIAVYAVMILKKSIDKE